MINLRKIFLSFLGIVSLETNAYDLFSGKVTNLESTYMPSAISFQMDTGNSNCPAGKWLFWKKNDSENIKFTYITLLTALTTGKKVTFYLNDKCEGEYLHLLSD